MPWAGVHRPLPALVLALLLVTAGCSFDAGSPATEPDAPTVTPAPLPSTDSPSPTTTPDSTRLDDPEARALTHAEALANRSFTVAEWVEIRFANGTAYHQREWATRVGPTRERYRYRSQLFTSAPMYPADPGDREVYSNGTLVAYRVVTDDRNETGLLVGGDSDASVGDVYVGAPVNRGRLEYLFSSLTGVRVRGNETDYRLRAEGFWRDRATVDGVTVANATLVSFEARAVDGLVGRYRLVLSGTVDGERVRLVERVRYVGVGSTEVRAPEWFDRAVSNG